MGVQGKDRGGKYSTAEENDSNEMNKTMCMRNFFASGVTRD